MPSTASDCTSHRGVVMISVRALVSAAAAAAVAAGIASAQTPEPVSPPSGVAPSLSVSATWTTQASKARPIIVNGELWLKSSNDLRKAFLVGAANMIALEAAYAKKMGTPPPPAAGRATHALQALTLDQISSRVTKWYEANPTRHDVPVIGVIWIDMVKPDTTQR
jgi:hypothetical protein